MSPFGEAIESLVASIPEAMDKFSQSIDREWIGAALEATGTASVRRRKIPAEQACWLAIGMALFANRSIDEVVEHLDLLVPGTESLARSAIPQARYRLGAEPLKWLFKKASTEWRMRADYDEFAGLRLYGLDGSCFRVQDTEENFEHFGKPDGRNGPNDAGYPIARIACLLELSQRLIVDAAFGPYRVSELSLAKELWGQIPGDSLTILDRGFNSYALLAELFDVQANRHVLLRLRENIKPEVLQELPDGSVLVRLKPDRELVNENPQIRSEIVCRVISYKHPDGQPGRLLTTLLDVEKFPADDLIELYHDRWEIELAYDELKTHMLERNECLRSKKPVGVEQEVWGMLLAYNLVRFEMAEAAEEKGLSPNQMSFRHSLVVMQLLWERTAWISRATTIPKKLAEVRTRLELLVLPNRRSERRYQRHVKIKMSKYKRNRGKRLPPVSTTDALN